MLPRAAELYRDQLAQGLGGDPAASAKARVVLREMLGEIMLSPVEDGSLRGRASGISRTSGGIGRVLRDAIVGRFRTHRVKSASFRLLPFGSLRNVK